MSKLHLTDLSRINPLPMDQSAAQSDNPEENVKISLQQLRESLRDGTALLQFDVSSQVLMCIRCGKYPRDKLGILFPNIDFRWKIPWLELA